MKINASRLSDVCGSGQMLDRSQESTDARVGQTYTVHRLWEETGIAKSYQPCVNRILRGETEQRKIRKQ
ncbi:MULTISPECIES: hypothetical protein [Lentibacillus]|uniref:Uncharacterized protein n=1 Tax=Lentibacillus amyloliquefaciens TaxID=1472767 RepID=A0A0U3W9E2_9BACI|nr:MULTISPECIES: hypothetical protein [Lentibacillus]ALX49728.1 hypothetical protein AOX59_14790 [Lentibacillus amyloliquefaciens]